MRDIPEFTNAAVDTWVEQSENFRFTDLQDHNENFFIYFFDSLYEHPIKAKWFRCVDMF